MRYFPVLCLLLLGSLQSAEAMSPQMEPRAYARACLAVDPNKLEITADDKPTVEVLRRFVSNSISYHSLNMVFLRPAVAQRAQLTTEDWPPSDAARQLVGKLLWNELAQLKGLLVAISQSDDDPRARVDVPAADKLHCDVDVEIDLNNPLDVCPRSRYCVFRCDAQQCTRDPKYDRR